MTNQNWNWNDFHNEKITGKHALVLLGIGIKQYFKVYNAGYCFIKFIFNTSAHFKKTCLPFAGK